MSKSFRIDPTLKSFQIIDKPHIFHRVKKYFRGVFLRRFWLWTDVLSQIRELISDKDFNEPNELFDALRIFFLSEYHDLNLSVYYYRKKDASLDFFLGDAYAHTKKIHLQKVQESDYTNEKETIESYKFESRLRANGFWWSAAIRIENFVFSFWVRLWTGEKSLRDIQALFLVGLSELIKAKLGIMKEKYTDPRTNLYNSKYIKEVGSTKAYSVVKIDINDFKMTNDIYGHEAGDTVLEELGKILKQSVRSDDKACRDGGDEFLLLIDSAEMVSIERIIERIEHSLAIINGHRSFPIYVTIGYCLYTSNLTFEQRVKIADEQMYKQKWDSSTIYRISQKIANIKNPKSLDQLLIQIIQGYPESEATIHINQVLQDIQNKTNS